MWAVKRKRHKPILLRELNKNFVFRSRKGSFLLWGTDAVCLTINFFLTVLSRQFKGELLKLASEAIVVKREGSVLILR